MCWIILGYIWYSKKINKLIKKQTKQNKNSLSSTFKMVASVYIMNFLSLYFEREQPAVDFYTTSKQKPTGNSALRLDRLGLRRLCTHRLAASALFIMWHLMGAKNEVSLTGRNAHLGFRQRTCPDSIEAHAANCLSSAGRFILISI